MIGNNFKKIKQNFIVCPHCGYNNEEQRLINKYGTCLRCNKIVDKKAYLKRRLWEANHRKQIKEGLGYYDDFDIKKYQ